MNNFPVVSVVMSVFNGESTLRETLNSVLNQEGVELEFIVVNDGSTDKTQSILEEYSKEDSRLKIITQENRGLTRSLIRGCEKANGKYIARQDVGDISLSGRLKKQLDHFRMNSELALVSCWFQLLGPNDELLTEFKPVHDTEVISRKLNDGDLENFQGPGHGTVMFCKSAYEKAGGYREYFYYAQDLDLWTRITDFGKFMYVNETLYQARVYYDSISAMHNEKQRHLRKLIIEATKLRKQGKSELEILQHAGEIKGKALLKNQEKVSANTAYFIGSCLAKNDNPQAIAYFQQAIQLNTFHIKAWIKLLIARLHGNKLNE